MTPSIPAKLQKSKRPSKNPAGPPCRFFFFLYVFNFFSRGWDEMFFVMCNDTFPSFLQKLAGGVLQNRQNPSFSAHLPPEKAVSRRRCHN